ncbi:cyclic pyranopterin monophosphate synthase MoaC [Proteocatella sphenisci]|uniref:cyclic pyranopterin monophosphate synthase MoaC n=1 Tax=Proteocatella sphenisci TaxID=181070 RepID=UPI00048F5A60|nr:cyclic pyranopterin monophosphate synthase MoaC [Proteocatella sphenisci]
MEFTHINTQGRGKMVEVGDKQITKRTALAHAQISMKKETFTKIQEGYMKKGDVLCVAQIAGITGAKKTWDIIPMCHPLMLTGIDIEFEYDADKPVIHIYATVSNEGKTGVEMEALTACSVAALTIYDMCKAVDKDMTISDIFLMEKIGGKSGHYKRSEENE